MGDRRAKDALSDAFAEAEMIDVLASGERSVEEVADELVADYPLIRRRAFAGSSRRGSRRRTATLLQGTPV